MVRGTFSVNLLNAKILTYCNLQMAQVAWLGISYSGKKTDSMPMINEPSCQECL